MKSSNDLPNFTVRTKTEFHSDSLRVSVHFVIANVSDSDFGKYACSLRCVRNSSVFNMRPPSQQFGCFQERLVSIIPSDWNTKMAEYQIHNALLHYKLRLLTGQAGESNDLSNNASDNITEYGYRRNFSSCPPEAANNELTPQGEAKSALLCYTTLLSTLAIVLIVLSLIAPTILRNLARKRAVHDLSAAIAVLRNANAAEDERHDKMKYDVFISYSSKDRNWVRDVLMQYIEAHNFRVCYDDRDFPLGCSILEAIADAVYSSHKVIAVVSPDYLQSYWCSKFEFVLTLHKILNKRAPLDSLLLVKYRQCQMPPVMRCAKYVDYAMHNSKASNSWYKKLLQGLRCRLGRVIQHSNDDSIAEVGQMRRKLFDDIVRWLGVPDHCLETDENSNASETGCRLPRCVH